MAYTQTQINKLRGAKVAESRVVESTRVFTMLPLPPEPGSPLREVWDPREPIKQVTEVTYKPEKTKTELAPMPSRAGAVFEATGKYPAYVGEIPPPERLKYESLTPTEKQLFKKRTMEYALSVVTPTAFVIAPQTAITGAIIGTGISEGASLVLTGKPLTLEEVGFAAASGATFSVAGSAVFSGVGAIPKIGAKIVGSPFGRIGLSAGLGAGGGYVFSGGEPEGALVGAGFGAAFGTTAEAARFINIRYVQPRATRYLSQRYLETGKLTWLDKALMKLTGAESPVKEYIIKGKGEFTPFEEDISSFVEQHRIKTVKGMKPIEVEKGLTKSDIQSWSKGLKWVKPENYASTLNKYIGSGQKQVLLLKQEPLIMVKEPVALVIAKTQPKVYTPAVVLGIAKVTFAEQEQKQKNPFLQYSGKPFYRVSRTAIEETELVYLSEPSYRPLIIPKEIQAPLVRTTGKTAPLQTQRTKPLVDQASLQKEAQVLREKQAVTQRQSQKQVQKVTQALKLSQKSQARMVAQLPFLGGGGGGRSGGLKGYKWYKKIHPIPTATQQLRQLGFGKPPSTKHVSNLMRALKGEKPKKLSRKRAAAVEIIVKRKRRKRRKR